MSELKYKKGDKVVILPFDLMKQKFGLGAIGIPSCEATQFCSFLKSMETELCGTDRTVTITKTCDTSYEGDRFNECDFSDAHILGHAFKWGEEIEVSDDGVKWYKRRFAAYVPGHFHPVFVADRTHWKHARPIRTPEIEITVKRDGKELTVDELKELTVEQIKEGLSHG